MIRRKFRTIFIFVAGLLLLFLVGGWIFLTFYFDDALSNVGIPRFSNAIHQMTNGRFHGRLGKIIRSGNDLYCIHLELVRDHYDTSEQDITLEHLIIDTVYCRNINWWDLIMHQKLTMEGMFLNTPGIYIINASKANHLPDPFIDTTPVIPATVGSLIVQDARLYLPGNPKTHPSVTGFTLKIANLRMTSKPGNKAKAKYYSTHAEFTLPKADFISPVDSLHMIHLINMKGNSADSTLTIAQFEYSSRYSDDLFALKHQYASPRLNAGGSEIRITALNISKIFSAEAIECKEVRAGSWYFDAYLDRKLRPEDPHPPPSIMPNMYLHSLKVKVNVDQIELPNGIIRIKERSDSTGGTGLIYFDNVTISVSPLTSSAKPSVMKASAYFLGKAFLNSVWVYPLERQSFDMDVHATLGPFDARRLNLWMIPYQRMEITDGSLDNADIDMKIRNGISTTKLTPRYRNFKMKLLPLDTTKSSGIAEGVKGLYMNLFITRHDNFDEQGQPALSATTSRKRAPDEELMEFVWYSLRKSLGTVLGGFE